MEHDETVYEIGRVSGEHSGTDLRRPFARYANKNVRNMGDNTVLDFGPEVGEHQGNKIRFRDALKEGHLRLYARQEAKDPKVVVPVTIVALGLVATALHKQKYRKQ